MNGTSQSLQRASGIEVQAREVYLPAEALASPAPFRPLLSLCYFHATTTGADSETLKRFQQGQVDPDLSGDPFGQGRGFFVWNNIERAKRHAEDVLNGAIDTKYTPNGSGLIVSGNAVIDIDYWHPDVEVHQCEFMKFLESNLDMIADKELPSRDGSRVIVKPGWIEDEVMQTLVIRVIDSSGRKQASGIGIREPSESCAAAIRLSLVIDALAHSPLAEEYRKFKVEMMGKQEGETQAWRYTGSEPLRLSSFFIKTGEQWEPFHMEPPSY